MADRYEIRGRLGMGGMGIVYEAFDRQRGIPVALKSLRQLDATALYRFKKEFRELCDLSHPNLVELYDLFGDGDDWFFTMELVVGTTFLKHVRKAAAGDPERAGRPRPPSALDIDVASSTGNSKDQTARLPKLRSRRASTQNGRTALFDEHRLRATMRQLAEGVCALHNAGKLHRDLKPSNVLVAADGRVVICDFGLVRSVHAHDDHTSDDRLTGTPAYMSPEQSFAESLTEASDWYSVGVMLYEALTGRRPHLTNNIDALRARRSAPLLAPHHLIDDVPEDLEQLCLDLLQSDGHERPSGTEVVERLGGEGTASVSIALRSVPFVGRERELQALHDAAGRVAPGTPVVATVTGASGLGKSALVRHFLAALEDDRTIILQGRCYERESVPYKALDSMVDALSTTLLDMPAEWLDKKLPADITALARLFPVLRRVDLVAAPAHRTWGTPDPLESRRRAFRAMRALLGAIAEERRLVLYVDDVQWGDADSAALIAELLRPPAPPAMLLVLAYRADEAAASSFLRVFDSEIERMGQTCEVASVSVGPLTAADSHALACSLLSIEQTDRAAAAKVAGEAQGNPFFVQELVHHVARSRLPAAVPLDDVLASRLDELPADAIALLRVLAVAGKPTDLAVAATASGLEGRAPAALATLRAQRLIRTRGAVPRMVVECAHDRIREVMARRVEANELATIHAQLARALELHGHSDPEQLLEHRRAAGHLQDALQHAMTAAQNAANVLAFDRAAALYRVALDLHHETRASGDPSQQDREAERRLEIDLGNALENAGRGADAATAFLAAAKGARLSDALELERRAAEQLIISGRIQEGLAAVRSVLAGVEMSFPETPRRALMSLLTRRTWLRLRGLKHRERDASQVSPADLMKVDLCRSIAMGLSCTDNIRGTDFQTRHVLLALAAGEPHRISRALSLELSYSAMAGGSATRRCEKLLAMSTELAQRVGEPNAIALSLATAGTAAYLGGRWREARELFAQTDAMLRDRCTGVAWEKNSLNLFSMTNLFVLGEIAEIRSRLPTLLREAHERGDNYADVMLRVSRPNVFWLVEDDPDSAERQMDDAMARWPSDRFMLTHYYELQSRTTVDLYRGDADRALARLDERLPALRAAYLERVQRVRSEIRITHAGAAIAAACARTGKQRSALLARARKLARSVLKERMPWTTGLAHLALGRIDEVDGDVERACEQLKLAATELEAADMKLYAAIARRQHGALIGGDVGRQAIEECDAQMRAHGIVRPDRFAYCLSPGEAT